MPKHGKKYLAALAKVDRSRFYTPAEAIALVKETSYTKFDATVEAHLRLGIDPRHADQNIRTTVALPHGTGKTVRVLVFAQGEALQTALDAGADYAGSDDLIARIDRENFFDFDVAIATPDMMGKVGRIGRKLGPRGLMPNPKSGTVVQPADLARTIREVKGGRVEIRNDKTGILHVAIGKVSFTSQQLSENLAALMEAVKAAKPSGAKGTYIRSVTLTSTMGPGVPVDLVAVQNLKL
ncbi:50S ribosomal protein L1 [Chloroflexus aggregans]|uniref:Large ribosomal subunit protein uL1 n=1 Tax=Chloroflexus aggregans (strain MD-66 / DSM 9485) TaxID=326427 RepID=RL1_CHLAD|nr:50S ribosomal protein L1 [Chloroflexus aggregans]B8G990.1 RecName: Full=Large ribosomal subunit protein uL1; AltName: Full=50S ribosomal protein L1 [Chloroflexus aggregans DSM 9485]ACL24380.1 ribosomal protein L1 [Chloroflexus aggregans DSM 9485]